MTPLKDALPELAQHAARLLETAKDEPIDMSKPAGQRTRLERANTVHFRERCFHYDPHHKCWNVQAVSTSGHRFIFTAVNTFCTCPDNYKIAGKKVCKHLIQLSRAVLEYQNK